MAGPPGEPQIFGGGGRVAWYPHDNNPINKTSMMFFNIPAKKKKKKKKTTS